MGKDEDIGSQQEQNPIKLKLKGPSPFPPSTFLISFLNEWVINAEYATIYIFSEWYQKPVNVCVYLANEMSYCFDYVLVSQVSLFIYLDLARWKLLLLLFFWLAICWRLMCWIGSCLNRRRPAVDNAPSHHMEMSMLQQVVPRQENYSQSRAVALHNVESTITELGGIFTHLATMVAQQGELAIRSVHLTNIFDVCTFGFGCQKNLPIQLMWAGLMITWTSHWLMLKVLVMLCWGI